MPKKERVKKTKIEEGRADDLQTSEHHRRKAEMWLWFGVIVVSTVMILFWLISVKWEFSYFSSKNGERNAVEKAQQNWNELFSKESENTELKEAAKKDIKAALDKIIAEQKTVSTTSTTTLETATTTTNTIKN